MLLDRTAVMHANLARKGIQAVNFGDDEKLLPINGTYHRILNRSVSDFCSTDQHPLVSIGAGDREWIVLDQHDVLDKYYQVLKHIIERNDFINLEGKIDKVIQFVRSKLPISDSRVDKFCERKGHPTFQDMPIISLAKFLNVGLGVCRHHGLFTAYLLDRLMKDKLFPQGEIMHCRDNIPKGAHVWILYRPDHGKTYFIDSMWNVRAKLTQDKDSLKAKGYGHSAIEQCKVKMQDRLNKRKEKLDEVPVIEKEPVLIKKIPPVEKKEAVPPPAVAIPVEPKKSLTTLYSSFTKEQRSEKKAFVFALLDLEKLERLKILNIQHKGNASELLLKSLTSDIEDRGLEYKKHLKHKEVVVDLERILRTNELHKLHYDEISEACDRQQFILGLLMKTNQERKAVLDLQTKKDLNHLLTSLKHTHEERSKFYEKFECYNVCLVDIEQRVDLAAAPVVQGKLARKKSEFQNRGPRPIARLSPAQFYPPEKSSLEDLEQFKKTTYSAIQNRL